MDKSDGGTDGIKQFTKEEVQEVTHSMLITPAGVTTSGEWGSGGGAPQVTLRAVH